MAILEIVRLGHPALRSPAEPVDPARLATAELQELIDSLVETMRHAGGVGLAAPQVGLPLQLFVYGLEAGEEGEEDPIPVRAVVNPMVEPEAGEPVQEWEGCLSIPGLRGLVPRPPAVRLHALDRRGEPVDERIEGFAARVVQHEYDHLNGVVFLDRMGDLRSLAFEEEWGRYLDEEAEGAEEAEERGEPAGPAG